jgi:transcriptional regulator with XRE-family HTH domain
MKQDTCTEALVRQRIRSLRVARGWSLDQLAARCLLSPSTLSRIETGHRRIALDQMAAIARALDTTLDQLVDANVDDDVVIRPRRDEERGTTTWLLSRHSSQTVTKMRITRQAPEPLRVHSGRDWFTVLSGTIALRLGERTILVETNEAAEFSTMVPHAFSAHGGPAEILCILDHEGERSHLGRQDEGASRGSESRLSRRPRTLRQGKIDTRWGPQL